MVYRYSMINDCENSPYYISNIQGPSNFATCTISCGWEKINYFVLFALVIITDSI